MGKGVIDIMLRDLSNQKYGKLTAIKIIGKTKSRNILWLCICECGNKCIVQSNNLITGHTKSCGCYKKNVLHEKGKTHGESKSRLYYIWTSIKQRCLNPKNNAFARYGGRGISICKEWLNFPSFWEWAMISGYKDDLSIDRKNNNGNYEPHNCRWVNAKIQGNNKNNNIFITYENKTKTLKEWSELKEIPYMTLWNRIKTLGWNIEDALNKPSRGKNGRGNCTR